MFSLLCDSLNCTNWCFLYLRMVPLYLNTLYLHQPFEFLWQLKATTVGVRGIYLQHATLPRSLNLKHWTFNLHSFIRLEIISSKRSLDDAWHKHAFTTDAGRTVLVILNSWPMVVYIVNLQVKHDCGSRCANRLGQAKTPGLCPLSASTRTAYIPRCGEPRPRGCSQVPVSSLYSKI